MVTRDVTPVEEIRLLWAKGLSLAEIARQASATSPIVRRIVGKLVRTSQRQRREKVTRRICASSVPWSDQVAAWPAETGRIGLRPPRNPRR